MKRPTGFDPAQSRSEPDVRDSKTTRRRRRDSGRGEFVSDPSARAAEDPTRDVTTATPAEEPPVALASADESHVPQPSAPLAPVAVFPRFDAVDDASRDDEMPVPGRPDESHLSVHEPVAGVQQAKRALRQAERSRRRRERGERKRFASHQRVRRRRWLVCVSAVVGLALFVVVGVYTPIMAVRDISVQGAVSADATDLAGALTRFEGTPLALVDDRDVHRALEAFPIIQSYVIERIPPHTLVVRIDERTPVLAYEREGGFDLRDPAGVLLSRASERPVGVPLASAELQDTASPAFRAVSAVIRDMPQVLRERVVGAQATRAQDVTFTLDSGTHVVWGDAKNTQGVAVVLQSLIAAIGAPTSIDVSAPEAPVFT